MLIKDFLKFHSECLKCKGLLNLYCISNYNVNEKYIAKVRDDKFILQIKTNYYLEEDAGVVKCIIELKNNKYQMKLVMN